MTYQLYIGSNNRTRRLELDKIKQVLASRHDGFTIYPATGYWQGTQEDSAVIIVDDDDARVIETINILKVELEQDAIGYQRVPVMEFI